MDESPLLKLPLVMPAQAQAHVTHNEALMVLDSITQLSVIDRTLTDPPELPSQGDRYIVPEEASGAWSGHGGSIAVMRDNAWLFILPAAGWRCWVEVDQAELVHDGSGWIDAASASLSLHDLAGVGIGGSYDETAPLVVHGPSSLFSGAAGHQLKLNKPLANDTASLLFQTGYSGRAEFGSVGDDDFRCKVSGNGSDWNEAIVIDAATGGVSFPNTQFTSGFRNLLINPRGLVNQRGYTSAAATSGANQYALDRWRVATSGQSLSWSEANGYRTMTAPDGGVEQVIDGADIVTGTHILSWAGTATATVNGDAVANGGDVSLTGGSSATVRFSSGTFALPQLEHGHAATAFEVRTSAQELDLCRWYFEVLGDGSVGNAAIAIGQMTTATRAAVVVIHRPKRMTPLVTVSSAAHFLIGNAGGANDAGTAFMVVPTTPQPDRVACFIDIGTPRTAGNACTVYANSASFQMSFDAEL